MNFDPHGHIVIMSSIVYGEHTPDNKTPDYTVVNDKQFCIYIGILYTYFLILDALMGCLILYSRCIVNPLSVYNLIKSLL